MGSFYRSQHELICVYAAPGRPINNFGLGERGRYRSNVRRNATGTFTFSSLDAFADRRPTGVSSPPDRRLTDRPTD